MLGLNWNTNSTLGPDPNVTQLNLWEPGTRTPKRSAVRTDRTPVSGSAVCANSGIGQLRLYMVYRICRQILTEDSLYREHWGYPYAVTRKHITQQTACTVQYSSDQQARAGAPAATYIYSIQHPTTPPDQSHYMWHRLDLGPTRYTTLLTASASM